MTDRYRIADAARDLAAADLLRGLVAASPSGWREVPALIKAAFGKTVNDGIVTYDFARQMEGATKVPTSGFADALIERL